MTMSTPSPFGARRMTPRGWLFAAGGLVLAVILVWLLIPRGSQPGTETTAHEHGSGGSTSAEMPVTLGDADRTRIGVTFEPVRWGPLAREVRTVAQVVPDETRLRSVALLVEGWVDRLDVDFTGQVVRTGDPLFSLYAPMVVAAEEELLLARRLRSDVAHGSDEVRANAEATVEAARRRLLYWGVPEGEIRRVEESGAASRTVTFRSAYSGVVVEKGVTTGQRLMPGDVAYRIADLSTVWLEGEVYEQDLPAVHMGLVVRAEFTALPGETRQGTISYIYPTLDPQTRTTRIRVALANPGLRLKPGMYATIRFAAPGAPTLSVPRSAVLGTGERNLVFVRNGDRFVPHPVTIGVATDDRVEIRAGLTRSDTVVASGTFLLDAESNLGALFGGMGNMPGMDMTAPRPSTPPSPRPAVPTQRDSMPGMRMDGMSMPEMDHSTMSHPE